ncbi:small secreted protein [Streptomyces sp. WAC05374]|uniref:small secreted protein n=1 Tax=Streptomyces sp. WAC05374 TaxID=2487420 RepID=UPI000F86A0F1|nr:small secreted protein [Streptomyces sp. WAC05374]RST14967.1 small secreted protein [Streptomyces sp. WAC05374]TDF44849.1 small secreted protein [Streptomyces sp. WAC05374]TDF56089.1 small secreted protein [Streptomyces sp. WAC05374]TDF59738.1 small secreted protein [Streptomyces sp. WAC05374]
MNKKLAAALSGGAVLVLALSGCSDDNDGGGDNKVDAWAKNVCDQAQPQIQKRANAQQAIISTAADGKPADIQAADSKAFQDIADADKALAKAVQDAGVPPVDNGEKLQQDAVKELNATATAYENLKKQVDALDPKNQQKFADGLQGVADGLKKIEKMDQDALAKLQSGELGQAMAKQPGCRKAEATVSPTIPPAKPGPDASASAGASAPAASAAGSASPSKAGQ